MNQNQDVQHLNILSIFHYIAGAAMGLLACFPIIHMMIGVVILISSFNMSSESGPLAAIFGLVIIIFVGSIVLIGWSFAICIILAGRFISKRKNYTFCLVMAGLECGMPLFGTILGIFTILTLARPSVRGTFEGQAPSSLPEAA